MRLDFEKLKATIHYVFEKAGAQPDRFDHIKLNKVLWYADAHAYLSRGQSITGATYIRKPKGPVAKYNRAAVEALEQEGAIKHGKMQPGTNTFWKDCYDVIQEADKSHFDGAELKIIDETFKYVTGQGSMDISDQTHGEIWELAKEGEEIPLYTVFAERLGTITEAHRKLALAAE